MAWPIEPHASTSTIVNPAGSLVSTAKGWTCTQGVAVTKLFLTSARFDQGQKACRV